MPYLTTIGLEIHLKLNSETKIFCRCKNEQNFDTQPNTHICPVCTGQPGALPLLSQEVVDKAILFGHALNAEIQPFSAFDRKNYFYPDLPMGFQITQFYHPIIKNGTVHYRIHNYEEEKAVHIHEAHLESDTAKMIHTETKSLLDFNRAGTPLLEIVTDPDFTSAEEAIEYAKEIQRIARRNNLGDADMEKGQMRVDVNISLRANADAPLGTRVEMKNINTFSAMKRAIESEYTRQKELLES
jgi:aspartyl-tRNA(Asn)/glutamyl-tRNA(Gln) amidotransferase subunit B